MGTTMLPGGLLTVYTQKDTTGLCTQTKDQMRTQQEAIQKLWKTASEEAKL